MHNQLLSFKFKVKENMTNVPLVNPILSRFSSVDPNARLNKQDKITDFVLIFQRKRKPKASEEQGINLEKNRAMKHTTMERTAETPKINTHQVIGGRAPL